MQHFWKQQYISSSFHTGSRNAGAYSIVYCTQTDLVLIRLSFVYLTYWTVLTQVETCTCFPPVLKNHVGVINVPSCLQYALIVCISEPIPPSVNSSICSLFLAPSPVFVSSFCIQDSHVGHRYNAISVILLFNFGSVWLVHFVFTLTGSCNLIIQP